MLLISGQGEFETGLFRLAFDRNVVIGFGPDADRNSFQNSRGYSTRVLRASSPAHFAVAHAAI